MSDWFDQILKAKNKYLQKFGYEPNTILINLVDCEGLENEIIDKLKYIRDTISSEPLGTYLLGLKVIKTLDIEKFKVCRL